MCRVFSCNMLMLTHVLCKVCLMYMKGSIIILRYVNDEKSFRTISGFTQLFHDFHAVKCLLGVPIKRVSLALLPEFLLLLHIHYFFKYFFCFFIIANQIGLIFKALSESGVLLIAFPWAMF